MKRPYNVRYVLFFVIGIFAGLLFANAGHWDAKKPNHIPYDHVIFENGIVAQLNDKYDPKGPESLYCLIGTAQQQSIIVDNIIEGSTVKTGNDFLIFDEDPPCQIAGSVGSLHTHPTERGCEPSLDDMFTFGEMHSPEPLINVIQCGINEIRIFRMPGKREEFDFGPLAWEEKK